jgi:hypothetical protein
MAIAAAVGLFAIGGVAMLTGPTPSAPQFPVVQMDVRHVDTYGGVAINNLYSDSLSRQQIEARAKAFAEQTSHPLQATLVPLNLVDTEVAKLGLPQAQADQLRSQLERGTAHLEYVGLFDDCAVDGDSVQVQASGLSVNVPLVGNPTMVAIPVSSTGTRITVTGTGDGGNVVTAGVVLNGTVVHVPVEDVGQSSSFWLQ